jgi:UDP-GlcNAc:undecaprenyl-phosphate GlcNAc-1-phosphate transferase
VAIAFSVFTAVSIISIIKGISLVIAFIPSIALFIFLLFNLGLVGKKWKMFLGDSGSMWLGFITAWYLIVLSQGEQMIFSPPVALWMVMLPLIDALSTFLTRMRQRKPIFSGDRTHIHHIMLDSGIEKWIVIATLFSSSILFASLAVLCTLYSVEDSILFYGFLTIWLFYLLLIKYPLSKEDS